MDEVTGAALLLSAAGFIGLKVRAAVRDANRRSGWAKSREESRRLRACQGVVRSLRNEVGFLLSDAFSTDELTEIIRSGVAPGELAARLLARCQAVRGLPLGRHPMPGGEIPITLSPERRARHILIEGKSGTGKTTLVRSLILSDLRAGQGIAVLGPESELFTDELLPFIPESRWDDVIYINPADSTCPVPINPLHLDEGEDLDLKVDETFTILRRMFEEDGGGGAPRMETILRRALQVLVQVGGTLLDFERLLDPKDDSYREWVLQRVADERLRHFWKSTYGQYPRDAHLPLTNRLERFLQAAAVRNMLCQPGRSLNVRRAMDEGKVLLFNLSDGLLGEANAQILGSLLVAKFQVATMSRADTPPERRRPFHLFLDEFQAFVDSSGASYQRLLSRARKYRVSLTLAHQQLGQIPEEVLREIFGNISTLISFRVSATDARRLSREFVGEVDGEPTPLDPKELLSLGIGEAWARVGQSVFFLNTLPPLAGGNVRTRDAVIQRSREHHGHEVTAQPLTIPASTEDHPIEQMDPRMVF